MKTAKFIGLGVLCLGSSIFADPELEKLAKDLVGKRTLVDEISTELEIRKSELKTLQTTTEVQMTDLQRLIKAEETRLSQMDQDIGLMESKLKNSEVPKEKIKPILFKCLDSLEKEISAGIPFKKKERLAEIRNIREMLVNDQLIPEKGLSKVWSMLESEFRLTRENGLYRQNVSMDDKIHLADIVKIGMKKMYFKISDEIVGQVVEEGGDYVYKKATKKEDIMSLNVLFDNFQKKIRTGYFTFPKI